MMIIDKFQNRQFDGIVRNARKRGLTLLEISSASEAIHACVTSPGDKLVGKETMFRETTMDQRSWFCR